MSAPKFMPGPLHVSHAGHEDEQMQCVCDRDGHVICVMAVQARPATYARLIAASPDLYEALYVLLFGDEHVKAGSLEAKERAAAALTKARGET
jgi:hypothetical protein